MKQSIHEISFGPKFCQAQFDDIFRGEVQTIENGIHKTEVVNHWTLSFLESKTQIIFDLSLTEWISTEQITFLFAWIRNVRQRNKKVTVKLPLREDFRRHLSPQQVNWLKQRYRSVDQGEFVESRSRIERRARSSAFLMVVYGLFDTIGLTQHDFINLVDREVYNNEVSRLRTNTHQVIPFTSFDVSYKASHAKHDTQFYEVIETGLSTNSRTQGVFNLQGEIQNLLINNACYSPFESKILSNVITQELYINSLQHSYSADHSFLTECYITAFLSNRFENVGTFTSKNSFASEKYPETLDFYKDKEVIKDLIENQIKDAKPGTLPRKVDLRTFDNYRNVSYLEYTFLDFGEGIHETLKDEFRLKRHELGTRELSKDFEGAHEHSQIIEYACLMDTSRSTLDKTIDHYEMVPRGLYFLVDMVRRYKGLLVVRSGKGMVAFDFSNQLFLEEAYGKPIARIRETLRAKDAIQHISNSPESTLQGTMVTIILPENQTPNKSNEPAEENDDTVVKSVRTDDDAILSKYAYSLVHKDFELDDGFMDEFTPRKFEYIGILFLYNRIIDELRKSQVLIHVTDIYNALLRDVNAELNKHKNTNTLIFFDFSGLKSGNASWIKILYYLMNTPKVNERTKVVIVNLPEDEEDIVAMIKRNLSNTETTNANLYKPFLYRPIPCISFKYDRDERAMVDWIGLRSDTDKDLLTNLLLGHKESYSFSSLRFPENIDGSLFVRNNDWVRPTVQGLDDLKTRFFSTRSAALVNYIKSFIEDGRKYDDVNGAGLNHIYLAANGSFQVEYLSMFEVLHDKYVARYFAKCLLEKYVEFLRSEHVSGKKQSEVRFTKIVTVTVSSQLLGVAIRDLIEQDKRYSFLKNPVEIHNEKTGEVIKKEIAPQLVMLSSYYSFDTEKPFAQITDHDKVLIVNDVISTGRLVMKLLTKLDEVRQVPVSAVFSIADTRIADDQIDPDTEMESVFHPHKERLFFTLAKYSDGIKIRKYKSPLLRKDLVCRRINPLLNTVVELKAVHGEQERLLYPQPEALIDDVSNPSEYFKVGHYQQNLTHNGYLTDMRPLFSSSSGITLLGRMKDIIDNKDSQRIKKGSDPVMIKLLNLDSELRQVAHMVNDEHVRQDIGKLAGEILQLKDKIKSVRDGRKEPGLKPDFIFYPIFSGIERINQNELSRIFGTHPDNIVGLQRFDTPKGWRFPFPAKRFNELTRHRTILILDSGSLTGESLVQLIDNVGFLDVKEIIVLSVITRVEDFYREFYSRLKSLKVKRLRGQMRRETIDEDHLPESIIPINVYFGVSLHIPVYPSSVSCPFCKELEYLSNLGMTHIIPPPQGIKQYIDRRKAALSIQRTTSVLIDADYLPRLKNTANEVDTKGLFVMRDLIGKIDSYRFYPEYFDGFESLLTSLHGDNIWMDRPEVKRKLELMLACLLHEPTLFELVSSLLSQLVPYLRIYVCAIIGSPTAYLGTYYNWTKSALVRVYYLLFESEIFDQENTRAFNALVDFSDSQGIEYLKYKIWDCLYIRSAKIEQKSKLECFLTEFEKNYSEDKDFALQPEVKQSIIKTWADFNSHINLKDDDFSIPFYNLKKFYLNGKYQHRHFFLKEKLNAVLESVTSTKPALPVIISALGKVIDILETHVKPNAVAITKDLGIINYHPIMQTQLGVTKPGILWYLSKLERINQRLLKFDDSTNKEELNKELESLRLLSRELAVKALKDASPNSFFGICDQYPCDFLKVLRSIAGQHAFISLSASAKYNYHTDHQFIAIHSAIFESLIEQIVANAKRLFDDCPEFEMGFVYDVSNAGLTLTITQNKKFIEGTHVGGLELNVKHFVNLFKGSFEDNRLQSTENYFITLRFLKHEFQLEN